MMFSQPGSIAAEWLETDHLGGFASGTVNGIRTRRYHALLITATTPPSGRMVLVNGLDAVLEIAGAIFPLTRQRYSPGVEAPAEAIEPDRFNSEPWPKWTWTLPDGSKLEHEICLLRDCSTVFLKWASSSSRPARLCVRPFFSGRDFHALHHENPVFRFDPATIPNGQRWNFYPGVPALTAQTNGTYFHQPAWYRNFLYEEERARGLDYHEDLASPGIYEFELATGPAMLILAAGDGIPATLEENLSSPSRLDKERARRESFASPRLRAADAYFVRRGNGGTIIAGYPWFGDWGRDTFISLRGLCLATGRLQEARDILVAWAGTVSEGMLPNRFPDRDSTPEYNSVDASLWYVVVVHEFLKVAATAHLFSEDRDLLVGAVQAILCGYAAGTRFGIRADSDGLLACGVPGSQLTWMDAKVGDWVVTPRIGKPVEVQALWLNALGLSADLDPKWKDLFQQGRASFEQRFWNEACGCLFDVVDVDHQPNTTDGRVRPNQIFAVGGLPLSFFPDDRAAKIVQLVQDRLWTPLGLRSLAPDESGYVPHYEGNPTQRDGAYHQGTVWPWLAGPFLEAWVRVREDTAETRTHARALLQESQLVRPDLPGLNHVPEIADAEPPFTGRGCPFQAWSLGELFRLERQIFRP